MDRYPKDWDKIAKALKDKWDWKCERCGRKHNPEKGYCLTVHHLDGHPGNCEEYNLACLCQRCHLSIQGRVKMEQMVLPGIIEVSKWFRPHLKGYLKSIKHGLGKEA